MNNESKNTSGTQYWSDELIAAVDAYMKDPNSPHSIGKIHKEINLQQTENGPTPEIQTGWISSIRTQPLCNNIMRA